MNNRIIKKSALKILVVLILVGLNWTGISAVIETIAYFNDTEGSEGIFTAGALDFYLTSSSDFLPGAISPGESSERTINFLNNNNIPKYKVKAFTFSGDLCSYLTLKVKLDGIDTGYNGLLIDFDYGPVVFASPEDWTFILTLPADAPEPAQGQTCNFDFVFYGSQIKNDLPFGGGFNDTEKEVSNIASKICQDIETRSKGYWKNWDNHEGVYLLTYLPQNLGDEIISTEAMVDQVFDDYNLSMRNKLKGQLLAMKLNVAHFNVGEYFVATTSQTISQIITDADNLLRQVPEPSTGTLEAMKDLLEGLVNLQIQICSLAPLTTNDVVLNEFLPNPEGIAYGFDFGDDNSSMPEGEWVELYNNSDISYDLSGWYIWDASGDDLNKIFITDFNTYLATTIIPAQNWLVVYMNKEILGNTGDTVKLFNNTGTLIDSYIYTSDDNYCDLEPTLGEENDSLEIGSCSIVPPNKSYARIPDGTGDWVDPIPTPGWQNLLSDEEVGEIGIEPEESITVLGQTESIFEETPIIEEGLESESMDMGISTPEELIIIDDLFLAPLPQSFLDFESYEESTSTEEIVIVEANTTDFEQETTTTQEVVTDEIIEEVPVIEETTDEVVDEIIIDEVAVPEPEPEPEQIEETPVLPEPELIIINEAEDNTNENGNE